MQRDVGRRACRRQRAGGAPWPRAGCRRRAAPRRAGRRRRRAGTTSGRPRRPRRRACRRRAGRGCRRSARSRPVKRVALGGDRAPQARRAAPRTSTPSSSAGASLIFCLGRQRRVEHERDAALLGRLRGEVELVGGDRRGDGEDGRDAGVAHGEQPRGVARRALGQQVAAERRERQAHADAGERLRDRRSTTGSRRAARPARARRRRPARSRPPRACAGRRAGGRRRAPPAG